MDFGLLFLFLDGGTAFTERLFELRDLRFLLVQVFVEFFQLRRRLSTCGRRPRRRGRCVTRALGLGVLLGVNRAVVLRQLRRVPQGGGWRR